MSIRFCTNIHLRTAQSRLLYRPSSSPCNRLWTRSFHSTIVAGVNRAPVTGRRSLARLNGGLNSAALATSVAVAVVALLAWQDYATSSSHDEPDSSDVKYLQFSADLPLIRLYPGMPAEIPPGRPGNLTPEQEAKLKDLWDRLHQLINPSSRRNSSLEPNGAPVEQSPAHSADTKQKRRFGSLLGRKKDKDLGIDSDTQSEYSVASSMTEDKHGQNKEYREAIAKMSSTELRETLWEFSKADDPDANLCRYLRARKWDVQNALVMLISTIHWRKRVMKIDDDVMRYGEEAAIEASKGDSPPGGMDKRLGQDFLAQLKMGKSFYHGADKDGRPICYIRVRLHRGGEQTEEALERYTVWTIETGRFMLRPPVDTAVIVFDMTGFTMANMDYTPVKFIIKVFEANYPESLGYVFVHRAPWIFQGVWKIIRRWLDPVVASKINFTSDANELSKYIDMNRIPKELGGKEDFEYEYIEPVYAENEAMKDKEAKAKLERERWDIIDEYERLTQEWVLSDPSTPAAEIKQKRLNLAQQLHDNYWKQDPYIRQRSLYDRLGYLKEGGYIDMFPEYKENASDQASVKSVYYDAVSELD